MTSCIGLGGIPVWRHVGATPLSAETQPRFDVVVVGGGPVGLTMALDLGQRGHRIALLNRRDFVASGSRAICFAKRTLDIWDRLGTGDAMVEKGVIWNVGKVFWGKQPDPIYHFDMQPVKHQKMPGFINLQQYHAEQILIEELSKLPNVDMRWGHEAVALHQLEESAEISVHTKQSDYTLNAKWVVACDGARSAVREMLGLDFEGRVFEDNFLIADIRLKGELPAERWFWFDPPFNPGRSALLHKQPDDIWRLDFQLGWNIDRAACVMPENVATLVRGMLGEDCDFEQEWYSVYTFQCRRMARFVHGRVIFAGDSAHLVSPFGARGCNGGIADVDNLGWKLNLVLNGRAKAGLLDSYDDEAIVAADENILNSSRSTDFMTPKSATSLAFRDAVLELATDHPFARPFVNSGRLSTAVDYPASPLITPDDPDETWNGIAPGAVAIDAPVSGGWLFERLRGGDFALLSRGYSGPEIPSLKMLDVSQIGDPGGHIVARYDLSPGAAYLIRPDQYVAARWRQPSHDLIQSALRRAKGLE